MPVDGSTVWRSPPSSPIVVMNASVDESGDHVGRNAAAGSPSDDAGSWDTPTGTRTFALPPSASAIHSSPAVSPASASRTNARC